MTPARRLDACRIGTPNLACRGMHGIIAGDLVAMSKDTLSDAPLLAETVGSGTLMDVPSPPHDIALRP